MHALECKRPVELFDGPLSLFRFMLLTLRLNTAIIFYKMKHWLERLSFLWLWFKPGLGVKRWLLSILFGVTVLGLGFAVYLSDIYNTAPDVWWLPWLRVISLQAWPRPLRILIFGSLGVALIVIGIWGLNRSLLRPFMRPGQRVVDQLTEFNRLGRGPRVVVVGGGHGQAMTLRALKKYTHNLTAIVTVSDDGGSSGELRRTMGILPPGDIRNCLAALSDDEAMLTQLFQYRFSVDSDLGGHSFGNLFISALSDVTGSFEEAVAESSRVLNVHGRVLPATLHDVRLVADVQIPNQLHEVRVEGESTIPKMPGRVRRVWLEPNNPPAFPPVIQAILNAEMIVIGPGSLYTSILPDLLVPDLLAAIRASKAFKVYVCNIATQRGETQRYTSGDHVRALDDHVGPGLMDVVVCNCVYTAALPDHVEWVQIDKQLDGVAVYAADLVDEERPWRHAANKLGKVLMDLFNERTGPLGDRAD